VWARLGCGRLWFPISGTFNLAYQRWVAKVNGLTIGLFLVNISIGGVIAR